ncbi:DNA repair protein XRCC3 [Solea senegalensis]|uniref:DNA repair protein XRCC3 n=1 Tax=Solea senegalensis TaxID=28829 RepID=A0AAV6RVS5_SOLSE|nr:DNA repair protein XRCC3 [Solea senegalensis]
MSRGHCGHVFSVDMKLDDLELEPRITAAVRRARFSSVSEVFGVSVLDLQRFTGLSRADVQQLTAAAAASCRRRPPVPALLLHRGECGGLASGLRLAVGCPVLDELLRGGLPVGGVTELSGESGAGKTQLALQLCLSVQFPTQHGGLNSGAVYICTEDTFPMRRLRQLITEQPCLRTDVPPSLISSLRFTDHIYIEHAADLVCCHRCPLVVTHTCVHASLNRLSLSGLSECVSVSPCPPAVGSRSGPTRGRRLGGGSVQGGVSG